MSCGHFLSQAYCFLLLKLLMQNFMALERCFLAYNECVKVDPGLIVFLAFCDDRFYCEVSLGSDLIAILTTVRLSCQQVKNYHRFA